MRKAMFLFVALAAAAATGCCCLERRCGGGLGCSGGCCEDSCCDEGHGDDCGCDSHGGGYGPGPGHGAGYGAAGEEGVYEGRAPRKPKFTARPHGGHPLVHRSRNAGGEYEYAAGPPSAGVTYPYYTNRGPRDFLARNPRSIGP